MKKIIVIVSLLLVTMVMLFGCGKTENTTSTGNNNSIQNVDKTGTLQGKIMDATTGAALSLNADGDRIVLIQGANDRGPDKLNTDPNDPLAGEYAFSGIPVQFASGDTTFKVVAIKTGYQRFEANLVVPATVNGSLIDNVINMIGNIYLFPMGATPGDVTVIVNSDHLIPVPNATVLLQQNVAVNSPTAIVGNRLLPVGGLYTSMTATTDANGVATFSGANLVLGGSYIAVAEALNFQGDQLATTTTAAFIVGTATENRIINMTGITTFFATSASNQVPGTVTPSGVLTVNFNEPIALTTTGFNAAGLASDGTATTFLVQAVLSNNNLTMTLTPNSAITGTTANVAGSIVTYTPVNGVNDTPFILQTSQQNSTFTFGAGTTNPLNNAATGSPVDNFVRQVGF
jgi:hypothetical protein